MNIQEEKSGNGVYHIGLNELRNLRERPINFLNEKKKKKIAQMSKGRPPCRRPGAWSMGVSRGKSR